MFGFDSHEVQIFRRLNSPAKIQDFLNKIPYHRKDTCVSPRMSLRKNRSHCMEGALLAATALRFHGYPPLVLDLEATAADLDHVIAVFQTHGKWGAISKTNHAVLRYREPIYATLRELVMSYFHEYSTDDGKKTLRAFSAPVDLSRFDSRGWMISTEEVWYIPEYLAQVRHATILTLSQMRRLRKLDFIEIKAGKLLEWEKK